MVFLWHWYTGSAREFYRESDVQKAADQEQFIAVIPEAKGGLFDGLFEWPITFLSPGYRIDEEIQFFDDMLACVHANLPVNRNCVASAGLSAGALFTTLLAGRRGDHLSSVVILSGGSGGVVVDWEPPSHRMPALVLWGGQTDRCLTVDFDQTSRNLQTGLAPRGTLQHRVRAQLWPYGAAAIGTRKWRQSLSSALALCRRPSLLAFDWPISLFDGWTTPGVPGLVLNRSRDCPHSPGKLSRLKVFVLA